MAPLYADGKSKKLTIVIAESWADHPIARHGMEVDWLVNEHCDTLLIEGHVDLVTAAQAMRAEGGPGFPQPGHSWMRYMRAPEGELDDSEEPFGWRGECPRGARGAEPVTISVRCT